jgi:hypothetical protein
MHMLIRLARSTRATTVGAVLAALWCGATGGLSAQTLEGRVLDEATGGPVASALVTLADLEGTVLAVVTTADDGTFRLEEPGPTGRTYELRVERVGYGPARASLEFDPEQPVQVDVILAPAAVPLDPVVVSGRRRGRLVDVGFDARRAQGGAVFIDRAEIDDRVPARITDLLRGQPGLRVISIGQEEDVRVGASGRSLSGADCQPAIWIDGSRIRGAGVPEVNRAPTGSTIRVDPALTELISPEDIEGIEVYTGPAGLPVRFRGRNVDCGVVLIWTRTT